MDHAFVIPVYRAAPRLEALVASLKTQVAVRSEILLTTSTPSTDLQAFATRHALRLHVNPRRLDIAADWNFALSMAQAPLVTLAHQDDLFSPSYTVELADALHRHHGTLLAFCDYSEHTPAGARPLNPNLRIKRLLCRYAFGHQECLSEMHRKLRLLSLGNPICCPSVMFDRRALGDFQFPTGFRTNLDWKAWVELSRRPGGFVYVRKSLLSKGIHGGSETTATIANRARQREDRQLFECFWPRPLAAVLAAIYRLGYYGNRVRISEPTEAHAGHPDRHEHNPNPLQR